MTLADMASQGRLERLNPHSEEANTLLRTAARRLEDAANPTIHAETRLEQAYTTILTCALAALRAKGYRASRGSGQHIRTLETLRFTLILEEKRIDYYQTLRSMRNQGLYEGGMDVSQAQAEEAIQEAVWLLKKTKAWLKSQHSETAQLTP